MTKITAVFFLLLYLYSGKNFAEVKEVALTIDDLPFVGSTNNKPVQIKLENARLRKINKIIADYKIPVTGFVIAGTIEQGQWQILNELKENGFILGNHTYSHANLNCKTVEQYIAEIKRADKILRPLYNNGIKYFRYPYLAESRGEKKQKIADYLQDHNYRIAPVTIDSKDYQFNQQLLAIPWRQRSYHLEQIKQKYLAYTWQETLKAESKVKNNKPIRQILLIHANLLNSHFLTDIIELYQKKGYQFISLEEALSDYP